MSKPTERFTTTVQDYLKYRPSYPHEVLQVLIEECGLSTQSTVADVGSGTGLFSKLLLDFGSTVYAVEPNQAMREAAEDFLKNYKNFYSIDGTAEATTLPSQSIDLVTVGTAFHWFDPVKTKIEFKRILTSPGWVMLMWNVRNQEQSMLIRDYEELILKYGTDYRESNARKFDKTAVADFFSPNQMKVRSFKNIQIFDWQGLQGRLLSASYSLRPGDVNYDTMMQELKKIFNKYQHDGCVEFLYETKLYYGRLYKG